MKSIIYHTRLDGENTKKVSGGSFGGAIDSETVERLVSARFTVTVKPSGRAVFVDREGREVSLYLSVDPGSTNAGALALQNYRIEKQRADREAADREEERKRVLGELTDGLTLEQIKNIFSPKE